MSNSEYELTFSLNTLTHLSEGLYSNIPAVLSELVANAWDADATEVTIDIRQDEIVIQDDGIGMSIQDANTKFLRIGHQKRGTSARTKSARHVMGRKGIGKLAVFAIANIAEVYSCKDGVRHGFIINYNDIEQAIEKGLTSYRPTPIPEESISIDAGTKIVLREIKGSIANTEETLRTDLARRFTIIDKSRNFSVIINDLPIDIRDRDYLNKIQFLWYLGEESSKYAERCPNLKESFEINNIVDGTSGTIVKGWIGTVFVPKDIPSNHHAISIFAHGKLIQEDILIDVTDAGLHRQYIFGEIDADFMDSDEEDDIVTSNRQRINQNDPRYIMLLEYVKTRIMRVIASTWTELRNQYPTESKKKSRKTNPTNNPLGGAGSGNDPSSGAGSGNDPSGGAGSGNDPSGGAGSGNDPSGGDTSNSTNDRKYNRPSIYSILQTIRQNVSSSSIEDDFKRVIEYDLQEVQKTYYAESYKSCIVMQGSVLEGVMLATLRKPDVLDTIFLTDPNNFPNEPRQKLKSNTNPMYQDRNELAKAISDRLGFEDYQKIIEFYIPTLNDRLIETIQIFRNSVHPYVSVKNSERFGTYDYSQVISYLASLEMLVSKILKWQPIIP